jgi:putative restriction endonuclease
MSSELPAIGTLYANRDEITAAGLNKHPIAGIDYGPDGNAISIILNGGYKDDLDLGDRIIYTGQGGQAKTGPKIQVSDQEIVRGNKALVNSHLNQSPVIVIRGFKGDKKFSPTSGYRYDGLYMVSKHWFEPSQDGPLVIRFELLKVEDSSDIEVKTPPVFAGAIPEGNVNPSRSSVTKSARIKRDLNVPKWIKATYKDECQSCGTTVRTPSGSYSQGAHIKGLGFPHSGADTTDNMLCLCPNCHVMFDFGSLYIKDDLETLVNVITGKESKLLVSADHKLDLEAVQYHRLHVAGIKLD